MRKFTLVPAVTVAALLVLPSCVKRKVQSNDDLYGEFAKTDHYSEDIQATEYDKTEDQGASIDPRTMAAIDDQIREVYVTDFERCLERDMDEFDNRWIAGDFTVEFTIQTSGKVTQARVLSIDIHERRTKNQNGAYVTEGGAAPRAAAIFPGCLEETLVGWEFDPPPEVTFTHTYNGHVGEAW
jgi:hypothetical protein